MVFNCDVVFYSAVAKKEVIVVENEAAGKNQNDSVIVISESSSDHDVVFVGQADKSDEQSNISGYSGDTSSSSTDFGSPPDRTEYLRLLYAGKGSLIPDETLRPPPRFNSKNEFTTSTPKKNENA